MKQTFSRLSPVRDRLEGVSAEVPLPIPSRREGRVSLLIMPSHRFIRRDVCSAHSVTRIGGSVTCVCSGCGGGGGGGGGVQGKSCEEEYGKDFCDSLGPIAGLYAGGAYLPPVFCRCAC